MWPLRLPCEMWCT